MTDCTSCGGCAGGCGGCRSHVLLLTEPELRLLRQFAELAFHHVGIELKWEGKDENEKGICVSGPESLVGKTLVEVSPDFYRPTDVVNLWGDPTKARARLGWNPNTTPFEELVRIMVDHDMAKVASEGAAAKVRMNLAEYLEKGIVK
mgnify:CR=1 FL=1